MRDKEHPEDDLTPEDSIPEAEESTPPTETEEPTVPTKKKPAAKKKAPVPKKPAAPKKKAPAPKKAAAAPKKRDPRGRKEGSGAMIRELLKEKKWTHAQIVEKVRKAFPDAKTDTKDVTWQKWAMKSGKVR
ncbi:hypothetical protein KGP36_02430 [Patescibacteria group bacterium]|nr:hypothetical protein [Patescibacteria group bacterium]